MLLETDVLIDLDRRVPNAWAWFHGLADRPSVPGFAALELVAGCKSAADVARVLTFLKPLKVLWPEPADLAPTISQLAALGPACGIGVLDIVIAATAVAHGLPLATFNVKHYQHVPGLAIVQPYVRKQR